jgi:hypothetical protein
MSAAATKRLENEPDRLLRVRCESGGTGRVCRILDLNQRGAFIESFVPLTAGSSVSLSFSLPNGHPVSVEGVVDFHQFKVGFGVEFIGLSNRDRDQIASFAR